MSSYLSHQKWVLSYALIIYLQELSDQEHATNSEYWYSVSLFFLLKVKNRNVEYMDQWISIVLMFREREKYCLWT